MSRLGKKPILIPEGATVNINGQLISVFGQFGALEFKIPEELKAEIKDGVFFVRGKDMSSLTKMLHGTWHQLLGNSFKGVSEGWRKELEVKGTGFRVVLEGESLVLNLGFSHPVKVDPVKGIKFEVKEAKISVIGPDKSLVGLIADKIRKIYPPDAYKGKGIRYVNEKITLKPGKSAKVGSGPAAAGK